MKMDGTYNNSVYNTAEGTSGKILPLTPDADKNSDTVVKDKDCSAAGGVLSVAEITDIGEALPERQQNEVISANAEIVSEDAYQSKNGAVKSIWKLICLILGIAGVVSYGYLGVYGAAYMKNGGLKSLVADRVFGGLAVNEISPLPYVTDSIPVPDPEPIPETPVEIENVKISLENIGCSDPLSVFNETKYDVDMTSIAASAVVPAFSENCTVLIIHTHGTEGYSPDADSVSQDEDFRTDDPGSSVVAVGKAFAEKLEAKGIRAIHCTEMFDSESYIDAYARSAEAVQRYLKENPEITYVIDIHRDAVIRESGEVVRSDGDGAAQLMIVCGTDEMGADFPDWRENFAFCTEYQKRLFDYSPQLMRHLNLRGASFNQQLAEKYLLLEVGTCGNTLSEAKLSAETAAEVFADLIIGK